MSLIIQHVNGCTRVCVLSRCYVLCMYKGNNIRIHILNLLDLMKQVVCGSPFILATLTSQLVNCNMAISNTIMETFKYKNNIAVNPNTTTYTMIF